MEKRYTIGVGLNLFDARAILLGEAGEVITSIEKKRKNITANETLQTTLELFEGILQKARKHTHLVRSVGIALGGIVDKKKGVVHWPQKKDSTCMYISVPLKKYLQDKFKLPVVIENDANACVWAEYKKNFPKNKNIVYLFSGIGCGIVAEGSLYRGKNGAAGEVFVNSHKVMASPLGDFSFFSQWPSDLGLVRRAKELISLGKTTSLIEKITPTGSLSVEDIFAEARKKDRFSRDVLKEAAYCLGIKLSFLINFLNPEVVIIGGGLEEAGDFFLDEVNHAVKRFSFSEMRENAKIVFSQLGRTATSLGAALLSLEDTQAQEA